MLDKIFIGEITVGLFGVKKGEAISLEIKTHQSVDFTPRSLSVQDETTAGHFGITSDSLSQIERIQRMPRIRVEKNEYLGLAVEYTSVLEAVIAADDLRIPSVDVHTKVWVWFTAQLSSSAPPAYRGPPGKAPLKCLSHLPKKDQEKPAWLNKKSGEISNIVKQVLKDDMTMFWKKVQLAEKQRLEAKEHRPEFFEAMAAKDVDLGTASTMIGGAPNLRAITSPEPRSASTRTLKRMTYMLRATSSSSRSPQTDGSRPTRSRSRLCSGCSRQARAARLRGKSERDSDGLRERIQTTGP
jgi:hypothetical protein